MSSGRKNQESEVTMNKTNKSEKMAGKKRIILLFNLYKDERIISLKEIERRIRRSRIKNPDAEFFIKIVNRQFLNS